MEREREYDSSSDGNDRKNMEIYNPREILGICPSNKQNMVPYSFEQIMYMLVRKRKNSYLTKESVLFSFATLWNILLEKQNYDSDIKYKYKNVPYNREQLFNYMDSKYGPRVDNKSVDVNIEYIEYM